MEYCLRDLANVENTDDSFEFADLDSGRSTMNYDLCLESTLVTNRPYNFTVMKHRMASL